MNFTYETQGAITYLVCELEATEQLDSLTLGMLTNNHIQGLAPVLYTEMNGQRFLKYNISAKVTAEMFFNGSMNKQRTLTVFSNILNAFCSADEYMIDPNCFSIVSEHVYLNVSNCETALICVPVTTDKDINAEIAAFFKKILFSTQFDQSEDASYITQLISYLNSGASFNAYGLKELVEKLKSDKPAAVQQPRYSVGHQIPQNGGPASPFNSTISIDDMPASMNGKQNVPSGQIKTPVQSPVQPPVQQIGRPIIPTENQRPIVQNKPVKTVLIPEPVQQTGARQIERPQPPQVNIPKTPVANGPGFAIPGKPAPMAAPVKQEKVKKEKDHSANGEKKMSFLGLLANYSKDNAALYKTQKEAKKQAKMASKSVVPAQGKQPSVSQVPRQGSVVTPPMQGQPSFTQPQYRPVVQPVPVQNSFNETTVLGPTMGGGETTVLSMDPTVPDPCLMRTKTGERIKINKPVFRIGKEKSYVDYFIGDNTAISRSHCNIHTENGEYFIEDTNSTNHTYVNGQIVASNSRTKLSSGDKVKLANEDFVFSV